MQSSKMICLLLICLFLGFSCSSSNKIQKKPPVKFHGLTLSKDIEKQGTKAYPKEASTRFSPRNTKVFAMVNFENLSGNNRIRWDWYDPDGNLYSSSGNFPLKISKGKYLKEATTWHSLVLRGDDAADLPGRWEVKVYINDELSDSKTFTLTSEKTYASVNIVPKPFTKDWGLIIGIQNYARLPEVQFAKKDALIMKDYFIRILRVPEENIIMLIDSDATKGRMQGYLENYIPSNVTRETTLYVYFAGHGAPDMDSGDPYLVPYDGDTLFIQQTGYKLRKFYSDLEKLKVRQAYVFLDSCFSGSASRAAEMLNQGARPALLNVKDANFTADTIVSLSASSKGQTSNAYPEKEHGLFTYYLLKALNGEADSDDDQWVSIKEIFNYVSQQVNRASRRLGSEQNPVIWPPLEMIKDSAVSRVVK